MREITHCKDPETGTLRQIVTPERLCEILAEDGDTTDRPNDFGPDDEWDVGKQAPKHSVNVCL